MLRVDTRNVCLLLLVLADGVMFGRKIYKLIKCTHTMKKATATDSHQCGRYTMIKAQNSVLLKIHTIL